MPPYAPPIERFWKKVDKRPDGCWIWTATSNDGGGQFWDGARKVYAHNYAYTLLVGPLDGGRMLGRLCAEPLCVNPAHFELLTPARKTARDIKRLPKVRPMFRDRPILVRLSQHCWLWLGPVKKDGGYALTSYRNRTISGHRLMYELMVGEIPEGLTIDHLCRVRNCINPAHMEPVTIKENVHRGNTISAINLAKTHCINGHEFTPENTKIGYPRGIESRSCRICHNARQRTRSARLRAERKA